MYLSIFVAQAVAIIYLAVGVGMLLNRKYYVKFLDGFMKDSFAVYLGGFMALIAGFALVSSHNEWVRSWEVLVTLIGWLALLKGIALLAFPSAMIRLNKKWISGKNLDAYAGAIIALGILFGYFGFFV